MWGRVSALLCMGGFPGTLPVVALSTLFFCPPFHLFVKFEPQEASGQRAGVEAGSAPGSGGQLAAPCCPQLVGWAPAPGAWRWPKQAVQEFSSCLCELIRNQIQNLGPILVGHRGTPVRFWWLQTRRDVVRVGGSRFLLTGLDFESL